MPDIDDGYVVIPSDSTFGSDANITCEPGFTPDKSNITCLTSGYWDNVTCIRTGMLCTLQDFNMSKRKVKNNHKLKFKITTLKGDRSTMRIFYINVSDIA